MTPRRAVLVTGRAGQEQLRYRTFDNGERLTRLEAAMPELGTEASLDLTGGQQRAGVTVFHNGATTYRPDPGAATLTVARDGTVIQTEPLLAWTMGGTAAPDG